VGAGLLVAVGLAKFPDRVAGSLAALSLDPFPAGVIRASSADVENEESS
jgi:hypothetical protein